MIFNTHSHLNDKEDISELLDECKQYNVVDVAAIGYDYNSSFKALKLAKMYSNIHAVCGLQPEEIDDFDGDFSKFEKLYADEKCELVGEIGLDYHYGKDNKDKQLEYFEKQIEFAIKYNKPISIHCRDAHEDTYNMLKKYYKSLKGIILHCYSGSVEMCKRYLDLGAFISISGVVTFKNAKEIKEVVNYCPIDRLLVETDDPYLAPSPYRGSENHPAYVYYVVKEIALIKQMSEEDVAKATYNNAKRIFK